MIRLLQIFTLVALVGCQPAYSQELNCTDRALVVEKLESEFGERQIGVGLAQGNSLVEVFASVETGTWTIVVSAANGISCMVASGRDWLSVPALIELRGDPT